MSDLRIPRPILWLIYRDGDRTETSRYIEERGGRDGIPIFYRVKTWGDEVLNTDGEWEPRINHPGVFHPYKASVGAAKFDSFDAAYAAWRRLEAAALGAPG